MITPTPDMPLPPRLQPTRVEGEDDSTLGDLDDILILILEELLKSNGMGVQ